MQTSVITTRTCSFCGRNLRAGMGTMLIKNDGSIFYFCSNKCKKNMLKLGRDARKFKWTAKFVKGGLGAKKRRG